MTELSFDDLSSRLKKRDDKSNKGDFGFLLNIAGCDFYRGAAMLSTLGALRTGVGIVRLATTENVIRSVCSLIPEAVFFPTENKSGVIGDFDICSAAKKATAVLCGCGMSECESTREITKKVLELNLPCVIDADGLNSIKNDPGILGINDNVIITPHIGEFARLCNKTTDEILSDPEKYAAGFSESFGVCVILKSYHTIIANKGEIFVYKNANSGLSKGGSGDILAGMTASFLAQNYTLADSAVCAVILHSKAALMTAKRKSKASMLPHEITEDLAQIFREFEG